MQQVFYILKLQVSKMLLVLWVIYSRINTAGVTLRKKLILQKWGEDHLSVALEKSFLSFSFEQLK